MFFIKDGKTDYKIMVNAPRSERVDFAVQELTDFLLEATSCQMQTAEEGYTGKAVVLYYTDKGNEGYRIYTKNGNYYVEGYCEKGLIYGVYGLLRRIAGLIFYTSDVYDIKKGDIEFNELDEERIPDIPSRAIHNVPISSGALDAPLTKGAFRMGVSSMGDNWGICNHSHFKILPPATYREAHPDWYTQGDGGLNLCFSNLEMRAEFVAQLKRIILEHPHSKYFMLGHEDHEYACECEQCVAKLKRPGGVTVIELEFSNEVVKEINAWIKQENIEREIIIVMFAYMYTIFPPVKKVGDTYEPLFDFKLEKNLGVMVAPILARGDKSLFDDENYYPKGSCYYDMYGYKTKDVLMGWRALVDKLFIWSYCIEANETLAPFNCWDALEGNYRGFKELDVEYVFEEVSYTAIVPNFHYLRPYVLSKLMWDSSYSIERAIDEFIEGFYGKSAAPYMRKYFDFLRDHCRKIATEKGRPMLYVGFDDFALVSTAPEYWEFDTLKEALRLHEEVVAHADSEYAVNVEEEGYPVWYMLLARYNSRMPDDERYELAKKASAIIDKYKYDLERPVEGIPRLYLSRIKRIVDNPYYRTVDKK